MMVTDLMIHRTLTAVVIVNVPAEPVVILRMDHIFPTLLFAVIPIGAPGQDLTESARLIGPAEYTSVQAPHLPVLPAQAARITSIPILVIVMSGITARRVP